jgi:hypothetical protein
MYVYTENREKFHDKLGTIISAVPVKDKLLLGDFNAQVGANYCTWENVLGRHGIGKKKQQWVHAVIVLLSAPACHHKHFVSAKTKYKTTWMTQD